MGDASLEFGSTLAEGPRPDAGHAPRADGVDEHEPQLSSTSEPRESTERPEEAPWRRATLVTACPDCGADPGQPCARETFHQARYMRARELAGEPWRPSAGRRP
jgi:hypothetical protein